MNGILYGLICGMLSFAVFSSISRNLGELVWLPKEYEAVYVLLTLGISIYVGYLFALYLPLYTNISLQQYFRLGEHDVFYLNEARKISKRALVKALKKGEVKDVFDRVPYEDIVCIQPGIRIMAASGVTASKCLTFVFQLTTKQDEIIVCNFGLFQENQASVDLFVKTMNYMATTIKDPYHILDALTLERHACYDRLIEIYETRRNQNVQKHRYDPLWDF